MNLKVIQPAWEMLKQALGDEKATHMALVLENNKKTVLLKDIARFFIPSCVVKSFLIIPIAFAYYLWSNCHLPTTIIVGFVTVWLVLSFRLAILSADAERRNLEKQKQDQLNKSVKSITVYHQTLDKSLYYSKSDGFRTSNLSEYALKEIINSIEKLLQLHEIEPLSSDIEAKDLSEYCDHIATIASSIIGISLEEAKLVRILWNAEH
ncbi:hypothetical protein [Candidatus Liberibacter sp.]|uniref:hypothetical protein n=1 Tax=Candidatus Liberibacter sp. TaxID=34022 RepID=UPI0015F44868|nr:hypothetical protein [Candidatus Liberibacter sp.]MBA5724601.1 hypothetical protein [Candidatus Liberibacter sp.]